MHDKLDPIEKRYVPIIIRAAMVLLKTEMSKDMFSTKTVLNNTVG